MKINSVCRKKKYPPTPLHDHHQKVFWMKCSKVQIVLQISSIHARTYLEIVGKKGTRQKTLLSFTAE
jgi:hypothetical protein